MGGWSRSIATARSTPDAAAPPTGFAWDLPAGFPEPRVPIDNLLTAAKVELGRHLFYDQRLSRDGTLSCATCHRRELAFTDGRAQARGVTGELHPRSAMSLVNAVYSTRLTWADPQLQRLEAQMRIPMFSESPVEMGLAGHERVVLERLHGEPRYVDLFTAAFPDIEDPVALPQIIEAIASFERTLISGNSPWDRYVYFDDDSEFPSSARRGMRLFFSDRLGCSRCHSGFNLSGPVVYRGREQEPVSFHNTGLYNVDGRGGYPAPNRGLFEHTGADDDMGRFRAPTLRNIAVTAPYMHDGSIETLVEVIAHYAAGGRTIASGESAGVGAHSPLRDPVITGFEITAQETRDLLSFLSALTDESFLRDPRFANPWITDRATGQKPQEAPARNSVPPKSRVPNP